MEDEFKYIYIYFWIAYLVLLLVGSFLEKATLRLNKLDSWIFFTDLDTWTLSLENNHKDLLAWMYC